MNGNKNRHTRHHRRSPRGHQAETGGVRRPRAPHLPWLHLDEAHGERRIRLLRECQLDRRRHRPYHFVKNVRNGAFDHVPTDSDASYPMIAKFIDMLEADARFAPHKF